MTKKKAKMTNNYPWEIKQKKEQIERLIIELEELEKIWSALNTRIETINERTKNHTIDIRELKKEIKKWKK